MTKEEKREVIERAVKSINAEAGDDALKIEQSTVDEYTVYICTKYSALLDDLYDKIAHINLDYERYYYYIDLDDDEPERDADKLVKGLNELSRQLADLQRLAGGLNE